MIFMNETNLSLKYLIDQLHKEQTLTKEEWITLIEGHTPELSEYLFSLAREERHRYYGHDIYVRGLIEFTNYCKNDCLYCGIRKSNGNAHRYRLSEADILKCCKEGYELGFRTFVLQGGEDGYYTDERIIHLIRIIKERYPDCAITLSIGEKSKDSYQHRQQCLRDLKGIGYQIGCGFMVGSPYQTSEHLAEDMLFMKELNPHMIGIGPFIPHHDTPFAGESAGTLELTLYMLGLIRLMIPKVLLPATTALGTIHPKGRELGILAGANVVMPNLSPTEVRKDYLLYDNKICTGDESAQCRHCLEMRMKSIGYQVVTDRGDSLNI